MIRGDLHRDGDVYTACVELELVFRPYRRGDLAPLEWFGAYTAHRAFVEAQFERHLRGENLMIVAAHHDFPVGQVWIDFAKRSAERTATIWALRVFEPFRGLGIGRCLIAVAEDHARAARALAVEIGSEKHRPSLRAFYEQLGFELAREERSEETFVAPDGTGSRWIFDQWILSKRLDPELRR